MGNNFIELSRTEGANQTFQAVIIDLLGMGSELSKMQELLQ